MLCCNYSALQHRSEASRLPLHTRQKEIIGTPNAIFKIDGWAPAELADAMRIEEFSWHAVRFRRIKSERALKADNPRDKLREGTNRNIFSISNVY